MHSCSTYPQTVDKYEDNVGKACQAKPALLGKQAPEIWPQVLPSSSLALDFFDMSQELVSRYLLKSLIAVI